MLTNMLCTFLLVICESALILTQNDPSSTGDASTEGHDNVNVVLFLAHTHFGMNYEKNDGIAHLNIPAVGNIKPCTMRPESNLPRSIGNIIQRKQRKECDCKQLLESSIFSLVGWARNAMGMTTAIVSLINNENIVEKEKKSNYYNYKLETVDSTSAKGHQQQQKKPNYVKVHNREDFGQLPLPQLKNARYDDLPKLKREINLMEQNIPIVNAYPHEPKLKFNDIRKYHNKFEDYVNVRRIKRKLIVEPESTQVFEIDSVNEEPNEFLNIPALEKSERPESIWDLLGIMSAIRRSFFINFLNPMLDPHQRMLDEENGLNFNSLGQIRIPSLFQLVQTTLIKLQKETKTNHANGFLLIIFGGSLSDISQPASDLVQSIKHVQETTNTENTLVIVTGSCPENHTHNKTHHGMKNDAEFLLPVYAKGLNSEYLSQAKELFDVPVQIKEAIEGNRSEENGNGKQKIDLEAINQNTKLLDVNNADAIENMFNKNWKQNIKNDDNENNNQYNDKWSNMRMRRSAVKNFVMRTNNGMELMLNKFIFIVLFLFMFFV